MSDVHTKEQRQRNMSAIKNKDTHPEVYLRKLLFSRGLRYRKNVNTLPGKPDLYFAGKHCVIFINGCFWHRHENCKYCTTPSSNFDFWQKKFTSNIDRDKRVREELHNIGIRTLTIWECTIKKMKKDTEYKNKVLGEIDHFLKSNIVNEEI